MIITVMEAVAISVVSGLVAGGLSTYVTVARLKIHLGYLRRDVTDHGGRIASLEAHRHSKARA